MSLEETLRMLSQATQAQGQRVQQAQAQPVNRRLANPGQRARDVISNPTDNQSRALLEMSMQMLQQAPGELPVASMGRGISRGMDLLDVLRNRDREQDVESAQTGYDVAQNAESMAVRGAQAQNQRMFAEGSGSRRQSNAPSGYRYVENEDGELSLEPIPGGPADKPEVETGTVPQGYMRIAGPDGRPTLAPIPGSKVERELLAEERREATRQSAVELSGDTVIQDLERAQADWFPKMNTGKGTISATHRKLSSKVPGTAEYQFERFVESALSNVGIDALQRMREGSPTGGALGQVPVQQQMRLEKLLGSLDISQDPEVLRENMDRIQNIYLDIIYGSKKEREVSVRQGRMSEEESKMIDELKKELPFDKHGRSTKKVGRFTVEEG